MLLSSDSSKAEYSDVSQLNWSSRSLYLRTFWNDPALFFRPLFVRLDPFESLLLLISLISGILLKIDAVERDYETCWLRLFAEELVVW